jgi:hypothetical protein
MLIADDERAISLYGDSIQAPLYMGSANPYFPYAGSATNGVFTMLGSANALLLQPSVDQWITNYALYSGGAAPGAPFVAVVQYQANPLNPSQRAAHGGVSFTSYSTPVTIFSSTVNSDSGYSDENITALVVVRLIADRGFTNANLLIVGILPAGSWVYNVGVYFGGICVSTIVVFVSNTIPFNSNTQSFSFAPGTLLELKIDSWTGTTVAALGITFIREYSITLHSTASSKMGSLTNALYYDVTGVQQSIATDTTMASVAGIDFGGITSPSYASLTNVLATKFSNVIDDFTSTMSLMLTTPALKTAYAAKYQNILGTGASADAVISYITSPLDWFRYRNDIPMGPGVYANMVNELAADLVIFRDSFNLSSSVVNDLYNRVTV